MTTVQPSKLEAFFVFNPTLGDESSEFENILSFYPPTTDMNTSKNYVGVCTGSLSLTKCVRVVPDS